jgi:PPK2 family polyphosphate:nucleotide phosphotransferase
VLKKYRIKPGAEVKLEDYSADDKSEFDGDKEAANLELIRLGGEMDSLQERLYAESKHAVLFVLQAMDTGGKDGTIRSVFGALNPQGCRVASFKAPNEAERAHDYLWRVHAVAPRRGEVGVFHRSQYEDVLVVRVHNLAPKEVWRKRYDHLNAFEKLLSDEGTTIVKFFLNISKQEQKKRIEERIRDPKKHWKFNPDDLTERALWDEYMKAYEEALSRTSTEWAPWYVIPANHNWYRNLMVARVVCDTLADLHPAYPKSDQDFSKYVVE